MKKVKVKVGIIGTGNIGTDLLMKIQRSEILECAIFCGRNPDSEGLRLADSLGINTSCESIKAIQDNPDLCRIVFDATSAKYHLQHAPILKKLKKFTIDLTPSQVGRMCVPVVNIEDCLGSENVNLVTCGGQATIPIAKQIMKVHPKTEYIEIISSISSKSAGLGTRANIDEFTQTTRDAIRYFTGVPKAKAIIILNPAEPPVLMHSTVYAKIKKPNVEALKKEIYSIAKKVQAYVPGYKITLGPLAECGRLTVMLEVLGLGDYLPKYSGNLDIITCAAVRIAEEYALKKVLKKAG